MTPEVAKIVGLKNQPQALLTLTEEWKQLIKLSRDEMKKYYSGFDRADMVFRGERVPDVQDSQARKRGEPEKITLPLTMGQVMTFTAFGHSLFNQRDNFYEQIASGAEDEKPSEIAAALLQQNLNKNKFCSTKLIQLLLDIGRFGIGITKETWVHDRCPQVTEVPDEEKMAAARQGLIQVPSVPMKKQVTYTTKYLGNKVVNVSPYRWFPDPRLPLSRWTEGEFCADEIEESKASLLKHQREGTIAGLDEVPTLPMEAFDGRRMQFLRKDGAVNAVSNVKPNFYLLTELQIRLNPAHTFIDDKVALNPDLDYDALYIVWILNDSRVVRITEATYDHDEFSWNMAQFLDDQNRFVNQGLCEMLSACQDVATWFINSRITSVRKSIFNQAVVDPSAIEIDDLIKRSPFVRLKPGRAGSGVDNWYKQITQTDVTQNHLTDVNVLQGMAKESTGINDSLLGQFATGRRSAKEAGNVMNAGAQRLIMIFSSVWDSCLDPQGRKMLSNLRQGLDEETLIKIYGQVNTLDAMQPDLPGLPPPVYRLIKVTKADLLGNYDMAPMNGTTPSQRAGNAAVLKEILDGMQKDPRLVLLSGLDPKLILFEILQLLNIRNVQRFRLTPERLQQIIGLAQPPGNPGGPGAPSNGGGGAPRRPVQSAPKA